MAQDSAEQHHADPVGQVEVRRGVRGDGHPGPQVLVAEHPAGEYGAHADGRFAGDDLRVRPCPGDGLGQQTGAGADVHHGAGAQVCVGEESGDGRGARGRGVLGGYQVEELGGRGVRGGVRWADRWPFHGDGRRGGFGAGGTGVVGKPFRRGEDVAHREGPGCGRPDDLGGSEPGREVAPDAAHGQVVLSRAQDVAALRDRVAQPVERAADRFRPQVGEDGSEGPGAADHGRASEPQAAGARTVQDEAAVGVPPDVQAGAPQHGTVGVGEGEHSAFGAEGDPVPVQGVVVTVGRVELVVHPQGEGCAGEDSVQGAEGLRPDLGRQRRRVRETPGTQGAHGLPEDVHQGVHQVDRGGGVQEQRALAGDEPPGRFDEGADRSHVRVVGVEPVLDAAAAGVLEVAGQLGQVDGVFLEDVDAPVHQRPRQVGALAARDGRTHRHAGGVDVGGEVVDIGVVGDAQALGVRPGGRRPPAEDARQGVPGAPAHRLGVEAAEVGAADQDTQGCRGAHRTPSSTCSTCSTCSASAAVPVRWRSATPWERRCPTTVSGSSTSHAKCTPAPTRPRSTASAASAPTAAGSR